MTERFYRAQLAGLQVKRLAAEASGCTDPDRLSAIRAELEVLHDSLLSIREEQLLEALENERVRRRWWQLW